MTIRGWYVVTERADDSAPIPVSTAARCLAVSLTSATRTSTVRAFRWSLISIRACFSVPFSPSRESIEVPTIATGVFSGKGSSSPPVSCNRNGVTTPLPLPVAVTSTSSTALTAVATAEGVAVSLPVSSQPRVIVSVDASAFLAAEVSIAAGFSSLGMPATASTTTTFPALPATVAANSTTLSRIGVPVLALAGVPAEASGAVPTRPIMAVWIVVTATVPDVSSIVSTPCKFAIYFLQA